MNFDRSLMPPMSAPVERTLDTAVWHDETSPGVEASRPKRCKWQSDCGPMEVCALNRCEPL